MDDRREQFISALEELPPGQRTLKRAGEKTGVGKSTYTYWRRTDTSFYRRTDSLLAGDKANWGPKSDSPVPGFLEFRERFFGRENFWFQRDAIRQIAENDRLIMILPPFHGKTTLFAVEHSVWRIMADRTSRITIIQKNEEEAKKTVRAVAMRLTDPEFYADLEAENPIKLYGGPSGYRPKSRSEVWGATAFYVSGVRTGEREPTMQAKGVGSAIMGNRADLILMDDIQDPRFQSPDHVDQILKWMQDVVLSRLGPGQKLIILGNRLGPYDIYGRLMEEYPDWPVVKYPAVLDWDKRQQLCPDLWPWEDLMRKRDEVKAAWNYMWMQLDVDPELSIFRKEAMELCRDREHALGEVPEKVTDIVIGCDPAASGYTGIVVEGVNSRTGQRYLVDLYNIKGIRNGAQGIKEKLVEVAGLYTPQGRRVVIEMNNIQESVFLSDPDFRRQLKALGYNLDGYRTVATSGASAENKDLERSTIAALFEEGLYTLPYGDAHSQEMMRAFIDQCVRYVPGNKRQIKDMLDAALFAEWGARQYVGKPHTPNPKKPDVPSWASNGEGGWSWMPRLKPKRRGFKTPSDDELIKMRE